MRQAGQPPTGRWPRCAWPSAIALAARTWAAANLGCGASLVVASLVNRTQRQRLSPAICWGR